MLGADFECLSESCDSFRNRVGTTRPSEALEARDAPTSLAGLERDNAVPAAALVHRSQSETGRG